MLLRELVIRALNRVLSLHLRRLKEIEATEQQAETEDDTADDDEDN